MCREIKQATSKMLRSIHATKSKEKRTFDWEIAKILGVSKTVYSNLINEKTTPGIMLWYKIINLHREVIGIEETNKIIENVH